MANDNCEYDTDTVDIIEKESDEFFLDLIKERPCLYNKTLKDYHDKIITENAMEEIAYIMNDTVQNCELRWKKLHTAYLKEKLLQEKENRSGAPASKRAPWPYFKIMHSFLPPKEVPSSTYSNVQRQLDTNKKIKVNKCKETTTNLMQSTLNNVQAAINDLKEATTASQSVNSSPDVVDDLETMIGKIIRIQLNKLSPKSAKKCRKSIMKCLIEEDSDQE